MAFAVAASADPVLEAGMAGEVRGVAAVRQFEHDDAGRLRRQLLEDHRDGGGRRLVTRRAADYPVRAGGTKSMP